MADPKQLAFIIYDGRARINPDDATIFEVIDKNEFGIEFKNNFKKLLNYARDTYGDVWIEKQNNN
jgi:hypothetical protein